MKVTTSVAPIEASGCYEWRVGDLDGKNKGKMRFETHLLQLCAGVLKIMCCHCHRDRFIEVRTAYNSHELHPAKKYSIVIGR